MSKDNSTNDSLEALLFQTHDINKKLELYLPLIKEYRNIDIEKSKYFANQALSIAIATNSQKKLGKIYGRLGDIAIAEDSVELARTYYNLALIQYNAIKYTDGTISILTILGNIAFIQDDLSSALQLYHKAIKLAQDGDYQKRLQRLYLNVGSILIKSNQYIESQNYTSRALSIFLKMGDTLEVANAYINLGISYIHLNDYQTARGYLTKALDIYKKYNALISMASTYNQLSQVEQNLSNHDEAIRLLFIAKNLAENNNIAQFEGPKQIILNSISIGLGMNFFLLDDFENAYPYLKEGYIKSLKNKQIELSSLAANYLSLFWESKGNLDSSLFYQRRFKNHSDSLHEEINDRKLALLQAQFNFKQQTVQEKLEREKEKDLQQRNMIILFVTIFILLLILTLLLLLLRLNRVKIKEAKIEHESLRNELILKNKELTTYLIYQVKNNEFILNISEKLKKILWKATNENKQMVNELIREIETDSASDNWDEFIIRFQQVHTDFYKNLGAKYPDLTSNELRLCAFLKLNMNTKDIASITYQSEKSITVARWRLRQKLGLLKEERLSAFLTKF